MGAVQVRERCCSRFDFSHAAWCSDPVYYALSNDDGVGVTAELVQALEAGVRTVFYSGQYDMMCHHMGMERVLSKLQWSGADAYARAGRAVWSSGNTPSGFVKATSDHRLTFIVLLRGGHLVRRCMLSQMLSQMLSHPIRSVTALVCSD
jgi:carboxypeptidase C (cathepsin A)